MSLTAQLTAVATDLISRLGYGGLAAGLAVDSAGVPIPSEVLLPLAGALVRQGRFNFAAVIVVATLAQTAGAALSYAIGAGGGLPLVEKYGRYVFFSKRELAKTQNWFGRYGAWLSFFGRCLPGIRTYIGFPAGLAKMPFGRFIAASMAGSLFWSLILTGLGYELNDRLELIDQVLHRFGLALTLLLVIGLIWYVWRHKRRAHDD